MGKVSPCEEEAMYGTGQPQGWAWCNATGPIDLDPAYLGNPDKECKNVYTDADHESCYRHLDWAMTEGITQHPSYYNGYNLTNTSSREDFQCALADMVGKKTVGVSDGSKGWSCPVPCNSTMELCANAGSEATSPTLVITTTTEAASGSSSFPWWAWILLIAALLLVGAGVAYALMGGKKKEGSKKKKRGVKTVKTESKKKAPEPPAPPAAAEPPSAAAAAYTAPPVYITTPQTASVAMPMMQYAAPLQYVEAAPQTTISYAMPMAQYAAPMQYIEAAPATALPVQQAATVFQQVPMQGGSAAVPAFT